MPKTKAMKKGEVLTVLSEKMEVSKRQVADTFQKIWDLMIAELRKTGEFTLPNFGKFVLKDRKARMGRNPKTGEAIKIAAKKTLKFRVAKAVKDMVLPAKEKSKPVGKVKGKK